MVKSIIVILCLISGSAFTKEYPDLVAINGGTVSEMFKRGMSEIGGMKRFVKKGNTVLVKPNICCNGIPGWTTTDPKLIELIIVDAYAAGAKKVYVFDHGADAIGEKVYYKTSGIKEIAEKNNAIMLPAGKKKYYVEKTLTKAKVVRTPLVHKYYLDADVVINVPILKQHQGTWMSAAMKNLMGVIWDRYYLHKKGLDAGISELSLIRKVDLVVLDANYVMVSNGPGSSDSADIKYMQMQMISTDPVLMDEASARILDIPVSKVKYIGEARKLGISSKNLANAKVKKIKISKPKTKLKK